MPKEFASGGTIRSVDYEDNPYKCYPVEFLLDTPCIVFYTEEEREQRHKELREKLDRLNLSVLD